MLTIVVFGVIVAAIVTYLARKFKQSETKIAITLAGLIAGALLGFTVAVVIGVFLPMKTAQTSYPLSLQDDRLGYYENMEFVRLPDRFHVVSTNQDTAIVSVVKHTTADAWGFLIIVPASYDEVTVNLPASILRDH